MPLIPWSNRISGGGIEAGGNSGHLPPTVRRTTRCRSTATVSRAPGRVLQHSRPSHRAGAGQPASSRPSTIAPCSPTSCRRPELHHAPGGRASWATSRRPTASASIPGCRAQPTRRWRRRRPRVWLEHAAPPARTGKSPLHERPDWDFRAPRGRSRRAGSTTPSTAGSARRGSAGPSAVAPVDRRPRRSSPPASSTRPGRTSGFFCLEPVTHPVDAFHLPGLPRPAGAGARPRLRGLLPLHGRSRCLKADENHEKDRRASTRRTGGRSRTCRRPCAVSARRPGSPPSCPGTRSASARSRPCSST